MKKGYVVVKLVKVIVVGPAGVGKTCLIYLLLSKPPPDKRHSTGCAERSIRVIRIGKEGQEWSEISNEEFQKIIAEAVPILCEDLKKNGIDKMADVVEESNVNMDCDTDSGMQKASKSISDNMKGAGGTEDNGSVSTENNPSACQAKDRKVGTEAEERKLVIEGVIQKFTKLVSASVTSRRLMEMELIYLTDCGGQQAYWDLAPIFLRDTSATLFVHRLCEKLDEHPLNDLYQSGERVGPEQRARLTTAQAFQTMLQGLGHGRNRSKIVAVGTHRDLVDNCTEKPCQKSERYKEIASPHYSEDILYNNESLKEVIFQVNTTIPDEIHDRKEVTKIRASIEKAAKEVKIPIWWFILQQILEALTHKLGRDVLSKEECNDIADKLGFNKGELDAAMDFFDKLNIFIYKKNILPNIVFTNAQVPLDKLSELVEKQYQLKAAETDPTKAADKAMKGDWVKFRDNGILNPNLLEEFKRHYVPGLFTKKDLLILLEKLLIVSRLPENRFFFPSILNTASDIQIKKLLTSSSDIAPRIVQFPTRWAPAGVFCCSVCHLQTHARWVVKKPSKHVSNPTAKTYISRNSITFTKHGRPGSVTFIDNLSFFAVCVDIGNSNIHGKNLIEHCKDIESEVLAAVKAGLKMTHHKEWPDTIRSEVPAVVEETLNNAHHTESCAQAVKFEVSAALVQVGQETSCPTIMSSVLAAVEKGLNKMHPTDSCSISTEVEKYLKKIELAKSDPELAFLCPKHLHESELHTACVSGSDELLCDEDHNICCNLTPAHTVWLDGLGTCIVKCENCRIMFLFQ